MTNEGTGSRRPRWLRRKGSDAEQATSSQPATSATDAQHEDSSAGGPPPPNPADRSPDRKNSNPRKPRRRWVTVTIIIATVLAVIGVGVAVSGYIAYSKIGQITVIEAPTAPLDETIDEEPINILLMGSDSREGKGNSKYGLDGGRGGQRSDTTILLHISGDRQRALGVSIPRDLWVERPDCALEDPDWPYYDKFNSAFDVGGPACTTELVQNLTGVPVNHIAVVDFNGFKKVVDALGGVEVCLNNPVYDPASKLDLPAGTSVVAGEDALAFVRARKSLGDGSDIGRITRQQAFLSSAARKATDTGLLLNPVKVLNVLDTATKALTVDQSLDELGEMRDLVASVRTITPDKIKFTTVPFTDHGDGANVDMNVEAAAPIWQSMIDDTPYPPPASVGPDGKRLTVPASDLWVDVQAPPKKLNRVVTDLQEAGFNVGNQTSAKAIGETRVIYPPNQEDAARTLAYATNAVMVSDSAAWSIRLEVGKNFDNVNSSIVLKKKKAPKTDPSAAPDPAGGEVRKADEVVCAG